MKILDIELKEFMGMWLNNIRYFKMAFVSRTTIILGRNGCGKSRLMEQLQPFAIQKKDFEEGGQKTITFQINDATYRVVSTLVGSSIKNTLTNVDTGEVLHKDVNPSYHNQALQELTGWSIELHMLFCGEDSLLTRMRTAERRYWFGKLSESDLAYALKFYTKLKEDHRDLSGAIKNQRIEIAELALRVSESSAEFDQIREAMDGLQSLYKSLEARRDTVQITEGYDPSVTEAGIVSTLDEVSAISSEILSLDITKVLEIESVDEWEIRHRISVAQTMSEQALEKLISLKQALTDAEGNEESIDDLLDWIDSADAEIEDILHAIIHPSVAESTQLYSSNYTSLRQCYADTLGEGGLGSRPANVTLEHIQTVKDRIAELNGSIYRCESFIEQANHHMSHYETADRTECPECKHKFVVGYPADQVEEMRVKRGVAETKLAEYRTTLETERELLTSLLYWYDKITAFQLELDRLRDTNPVDYMILVKCDHDLLGVLAVLENDWAFKVKLDAMRVSRADLSDRLARASKYSPAALAEIKQQIEHTEEDYNAYKTDYDALTRQLAERTEYMATRDRLKVLEEKLNIYYQSAIDKENALVLLYEYEDISNEMSRIWRLLEETRSRFALMDENRIQLDRMRARLATLTAEYEISAQLVKSMGPEEGLLAKHLYRSITRVTDMMSEFIRSNWGYGMEVLPCDIENGELNYRFPYRLADQPKPVADISMSSKGQQKLFNLAFIYTVYVIKNLRGFPLLLDEPFNGFDEEHKDTNIKFINNRLERGDHSQLFIISHDPAIHFQLTQSDYLVIDANGTSLPKVYNQNVVMH